METRCSEEGLEKEARDILDPFLQRSELLGRTLPDPAPSLTRRWRRSRKRQEQLPLHGPSGQL